MTLSAFEQQLIQLLTTLSPNPAVVAGVPDPLRLPAAATLFLHLDGLEPQPPIGESSAQRRQPAAATLLTPLPIPSPRANGPKTTGRSPRGARAPGTNAEGTDAKAIGAPVSVPLPPRDLAAYPRLVEVFTPEGRLLPIPDACALDASGTQMVFRLPPAADLVWLRWESNQPNSGYRESCEARLGLRLAACAPEADTAESLLLAALALLLRSIHQRHLILLQPPLPATPPAPAVNPVPFLLQLRLPLPVPGPLRRDPPTPASTGAAVACCRLRLWLQGTLEWALLQPEAPAGGTITSVELQGDPLRPFTGPPQPPSAGGAA